MLTAFLLGLLTASPAGDRASSGPLDELVRELELKHCDEAFALIAAAKASDPASAAAAAAGQSIARDSAHCRKDPAVALAFTELAVRLAPDDRRVQLAHVENLIVLKERGEAARILDRLLEKDPDDGRARLERGKLAVAEGEHALAIKTLGPLAADGSYRAEAQPLLEASRKALKEQKDSEQDLAWAAAEARDKAKAVDPALLKASQPSPDSGKLVASIKGKVATGDDHTFVVKGTKKGLGYLFRATGECTRKASRSHHRHGSPTPADPGPSMFGIDFAVQFGGQDPRQLAAGQGSPEHNEIPFVADADGVSIRVFDRGGADKGVRCSFSDFAVVVQ